MAILHETVTIRTVAAMVLILGAVLWIQLASRAANPNTAEMRATRPGRPGLPERA